MLTAVQGVYRNGRVELDEQPAVKEGRRAIITFLPDENVGTGRRITFGMFAKKGQRLSTEEDFAEAKKIWDSKDHHE